MGRPKDIFIFFISVFILLCPVNVMGLGNKIAKLVITITSPVSNDSCASDFVFKFIKDSLGNKTIHDSIANVLSKTGGSWAVTSSLSGVQAAFLFDSKDQQLQSLLLNLVHTLSNIRIRKSKDLSNSIDSALYAKCAQEANWIDHDPVSIYSVGLNASITEQLNDIVASSTLKCNLFDQSDMSSNSLVVKGSNYAISHIFSWNTYSIQNFISAKFMGEQFIHKFNNRMLASYKLWAAPGRIYLALILKGSENELFNQLTNIRLFVGSANDLPAKLAKEWNHFSSLSQKILTEDNRDVLKSALFIAWLKHWAPKENEFSNNLKDFAAPSEHKILYVSPSSTLNELNYSGNEKVKFVANKFSDNKNLIDVVIAIRDTNLANIKKSLSSANSFNFPVTIKIHRNCLLIGFCADNDELKPRLEALKNKLGTTNVINNASISVAAVGSQQPYILKYKLLTYWSNANKQKTTWQNARIEDIAKAVGVSFKNLPALKGKFNLKKLSGRGRAELLAILALDNKKIPDFKFRTY